MMEFKITLGNLEQSLVLNNGEILNPKKSLSVFIVKIASVHLKSV